MDARTPFGAEENIDGRTVARGARHALSAGACIAAGLSFCAGCELAAYAVPAVQVRGYASQIAGARTGWISGAAVESTWALDPWLPGEASPELAMPGDAVRGRAEIVAGDAIEADFAGANLVEANLVDNESAARVAVEPAMEELP